MNEFRVSPIQTTLFWEDQEKNIDHFTGLIQKLEATDLIILPEMFSTGFSMKPELNYEEVNGMAFRWMQNMAQSKETAICGSLIVRENDSFFNRLYFVLPDSNYYTYDKKHLFTLAGEEKVYTAGKEKILIDYKGWKISPLICYDLRFPVWCRNVEEADLMLFVANWPERRSEAWKSLLKARAIENMCYVLGLNRIGDDGNGIYHSGDSGIYNELGELISSIEAGEESCETYTLHKDRIYQSRERFNFLNDRDSFKIL